MSRIDEQDDLLAKLETWKNGHKARALSIHIENGYGSSSWVVELHGNGASVVVVESVDCGGEKMKADGVVAGFEFHKDEGKLWFEIEGEKRGEWAGLDRTLRAALAIAEERKL